MYRYVLFDLDGTLSDSSEGITNSVRYAIGRFGKEVDENTLTKFIGPPLTESFMKFYGLTAEESFEVIGYYREYFRKSGIFENRLYPGIHELLSRLKKNRRTLVLTTSKPEEFAKETVRLLGIDGYFDMIAAATMDETTRTKKSEVVEYAIGLIGAENTGSTVMVGDHRDDIEGANIFNIDSIAVTYGFGDPDDIKAAGPTHYASSPEEIGRIILQ